MEVKSLDKVSTMIYMGIRSYFATTLLEEKHVELSVMVADIVSKKAPDDSVFTGILSVLEQELCSKVFAILGPVACRSNKTLTTLDSSIYALIVQNYLSSPFVYEALMQPLRLYARKVDASVKGAAYYTLSDFFRAVVSSSYIAEDRIEASSYVHRVNCIAIDKLHRDAVWKATVDALDTANNPIEKSSGT